MIRLLNVPCEVTGEPLMYKLPTRLAAEAIGTFWLVLGVIGTAVLAGDKVGYLGVSLAIGLTVLTGAYAFGPISGGHFNPAVSIGLATAGKFAWKDVLPYLVAQLVGGVAGAGVVLAIASGKTGFSVAGGFASNGYDGDFYPLIPVLVIEAVLTAMFLIVILSVTHSRAAAGFAPIAIGLTLTLIHLIAIPVSNASVNPARSLATAIFAGGTPLAQVWVFFAAPIAGAIVGGLAFKAVLDRVPAKA